MPELLTSVSAAANGLASTILSVTKMYISIRIVSKFLELLLKDNFYFNFIMVCRISFEENLK